MSNAILHRVRGTAVIGSAVRHSIVSLRQFDCLQNRKGFARKDIAAMPIGIFGGCIARWRAKFNLRSGSYDGRS